MKHFCSSFKISDGAIKRQQEYHISKSDNFRSIKPLFRNTNSIDMALFEVLFRTAKPAIINSSSGEYYYTKKQEDFEGIIDKLDSSFPDFKIKELIESISTDLSKIPLFSITGTNITVYYNSINESFLINDYEPLNNLINNMTDNSIVNLLQEQKIIFKGTDFINQKPVNDKLYIGNSIPLIKKASDYCIDNYFSFNEEVDALPYIKERFDRRGLELSFKNNTLDKYAIYYQKY